jgi:predicted transcriptional regulator
MIDKRYQFYVAISGDDMSPQRRVLQQTIASLGCFSWIMDRRTAQSTSFARRQIDDCDYFIIMTAENYGDKSISGVSYMHLEYIYALTKKKPIIFCCKDVDLNTVKTLSREDRTKLNDLIAEVKSNAQLVISYKTEEEIDQSVRKKFKQLILEHSAQGWIRPAQTVAIMQENQRLKQQLQELGAERLSATRTNMQSVQIDVEEEIDSITFDYKVHAYQDSNFAELHPTRTMSWLDVLCIVGPAFDVRTSEDKFSSYMNAYLDDTSLLDIQKSMPKAHATTRSQINLRALNAIRMKMRSNGWVIPVGIDDKERVQWELTELGAKLIENANHTTKVIK